MFDNIFRWGNVEKYSRVGQATDDNIILPMRIARWITTATDTYSEYVMLLLHGNIGYANKRKRHASIGERGRPDVRQWYYHWCPKITKVDAA
jgi:hypothetical protein